MTIPIVLMIATGALCALYLLIIAARAYRKFQGPMVVTCPETNQPVSVAVDVAHAALTAAIAATELRLKRCTRWPERQECGQQCLRQIELAPEDCMVRTILSQWYAGKSCAVCGTLIGPITSWDHKPGLISADGTTMDYTAVPVERLPEVLATHGAVCWNCEVAEGFRRRNPELVIDWPAGTAPRHAGAHSKAN